VNSPSLPIKAYKTTAPVGKKIKIIEKIKKGIKPT
jgi:hypothetical protein